MMRGRSKSARSKTDCEAGRSDKGSRWCVECRAVEQEDRSHGAGEGQERVECDAGGECEQENENSGQRRESKAGERRVRARRSRQESEGGAGVVTGRRVRATVLERQPRLA